MHIQLNHVLQEKSQQTTNSLYNKKIFKCLNNKKNNKSNILYRILYIIVKEFKGNRMRFVLGKK